MEPKRVFELGEDMTKLTARDGEGCVVILRPRTPRPIAQLTDMIKNIDIWRRDTGVNIRALIVPHDFDVFVQESGEEP